MLTIRTCSLFKRISLWSLRKDAAQFWCKSGSRILVSSYFLPRLVGTEHSCWLSCQNRGSSDGSQQTSMKLVCSNQLALLGLKALAVNHIWCPFVHVDGLQTLHQSCWSRSPSHRCHKLSMGNSCCLSHDHWSLAVFPLTIFMTGRWRSDAAYWWNLKESLKILWGLCVCVTSVGIF